MRLIDADALIEHLRKDPLFCMVERYGIEGVIENAPTIEPTDTDLISRADVLGYIDRVTNSGLGRNKSLDYIAKYVDRLPSADRPKGEWIRYKRCDAEDDEIYAVMEAPKGKFFCNQCGKSAIKSDFCPNCDADMRKEGK